MSDSSRTGAIVLLAAILAVTAFATGSLSDDSDAKPVEFGKIIFECDVRNSEVTVVGFNDDGETAIEIPDSVPRSIFGLSDRACDVVAIGDGAFAGSGIVKVYGGGNVKTIGDGAFKNCSNLEFVAMLHGNILEEIGSEAFYGTNVVGALPDSLQSIGANAFKNTSAETFIVPLGAYVAPGGLGYDLYDDDGSPIDGANSGGCLFTLQDGKLVKGAVPGYEYVRDYVVYTAGLKQGTLGLTATGYVPGITNAKILSYMGADSGRLPVFGVGANAFKDCRTVTSADIHAHEISSKAFANTSLTTLTTDGGKIGSYAFYNCEFLYIVNLGDGIEIGGYAFARCPHLSVLTVKEIFSLDATAFQGTSFYDGKTLMAKTSDSLSFGFFHGSKSVLYKLQDAFIEGDIAYGVRTPSEVVVVGCSPELENIDIGATVSHNGATFNVIGIGFHAFSESPSLRTLHYHGTGFVDDTAAMLCSKLHEVVLDNVVSIGDAAFAWCPSLTDIDLPEGLVSMGDRVFAGAYLERVSVPSTLASLGDRSLTDLDVYDCYKTVKLAQTAENLAGKTLVKEGTAMVVQAEDEDRFSVGGVIYEMTEAIDYVVAAVGAENGVTTLEIPGEVRFGNVDYYVEGVADRAFYGNEAIVSAKVDVNIGDRAFCKCTGLKTVVLGTGCYRIDECAFYGCSSLESVTAKAQSLDLGAKCFAGCGSLKEMSFEMCYLTIGSNALYGIRFLDGDKALSKTSDNLSGRRFVGSDSILRLDLDEFVFGGVVYKPMSSKAAAVVGYEDRITTANIYETIYYGQDRYEVTRVEPRAFYGCPTLVSLTCNVPIGERAFANCPALDSVYAEACSYVGEYAFFKCPITELHVGSDLGSTDIAKSAFSECRSLRDVVFGGISSLGANAFYRTVFYAPDAKTVLSHSVDDLSERSFMKAEGKLVCCVYDGYKFVYGGVEYTMNATADQVAFATGHVNGIKNVTILDYVSLGWNEYPVTAVLSKAFYGCDSLLTADVQVDVGSKAFANCVNLRVLSVGDDDGWTCSLGDYAFYGCTGLERVTFAGTVEIGSKALEKIKFYDGNTLLEKNSENLSGRTFVGSGSVLKLYIEPFSYMGVKYAPQNSWQVLVTGREADVDTIWVDSNVTDGGVEYEVAGVADKAFYKDTSLKAVYYDGFGGIGNRAFANCTSLEIVQLWGELEAIGEYAFYGCTGLDEISIPDPVTDIGRSAFSGCTGLETIYIPYSVESIGANAFHGLSFYYADRVTPMPLDSMPGRTFEAFADRCLASDIAEKDVLMFDDVYYLVGHELIEGEYDEDMYAYAVSYRPGIVEADIADLDVFGTEIPVKIVAKEAFKNCDTLTSLRVQAGEVGYKAFANCVNLADVDLGGVVIIQDYAFYGCKSIESLDIEAVYMGASAFSGCVGLKDVVFGLLFYIGDNAFYKCRFFDETGTVQLDPNAANLSRNAFSGVYSKLVREVAVGDRFVQGDYGYRITSVEGLTVEVDVFDIDDVCEVPSEVAYAGKTYAVTSMNSDGLPQCETIVLPPTLTEINGKMEQNRLVNLVLGSDVSFTDSSHNELRIKTPASGTKYHQATISAGTYYASTPGGELSYVLIGS